MPDFLLSPKQQAVLTWLKDKETEEVFYGGGAGSAKSFLGCYWHVKRRLMYPKTRGVIGRKKINVLKQSTMVTLWKVMGMLGLKPGVHYRYNDNKSTIKWYNGSETIMLELFYYPSDPNFERFGSTEYTDVFIDEAPEITKRAAEILKSRVRWMLADYNLLPKCLYTGNPSDSWIKQEFVKDKKGFIELPAHRKRMLALIDDNPDKNFVRVYKSNLEKLTNEYDKERLLYGNWDAVPRTGKELYHTFHRSVHVGRPEYNPDLPLHITFDFNVVPFMTLLVYQVTYHERKYYVNGLKEYCLEHPFNRTKDVCIAFANDFKKHLRGVFYYGDYSGRARNTSSLSDEYRHNYDIIRSYLKEFMHDRSDRVIRNPKSSLRVEFLHDIFMGKLPIVFMLHEDMEKTIAEFNYMLQGPDGLKHKEVVVDKDTGIAFEKYGHPSDATEYFLCSSFEDYFRAYETGTKFI